MIVFVHDFYFIILLLVAGGGYWVAKTLNRRHEASQGAPPLDYRDPYLIAVLRGGPHAAVELAVVGLVDRGLLKPVDGTFDLDAKVITTRADAADFGANALERAILDAARKSIAASEIAEGGAVALAAEGYQGQLAGSKLIVDDEYRSRRLSIAIWCAGPAIAVILVRMFTFLPGGGGGGWAFVGGAVVLVAYFVALLRGKGKLTQGGQALLADLGSLFAGLRDRRYDLAAARMSNDALFCAAVFGLAALPSVAFPAAAFYVAEEERRKQSSSDSDSGGGCGSSGCSSDGGGSGCSSDSGGSSCGGGCGGGCS